VKPWPKSEVERLVALCEREGAHAKVSSIHVNAWFGDYDKVAGFRHFLESKGGLPPESAWLFIGDSPNDAPMFGAFQNSVGVANLKRFLGDLSHSPRWVTKAESGAGFSEMVKHLIRFKRK
jgi:hydroxymethylpyrimidine pyrophosphatase-like HAD family hydrolase